MPKISIIVVTYQSADWIGACLQGLKNQCFQDFEVVVVDNASTDDTVDIVAAQHLPRLQLIQSGHNAGFAKGCNLGAGAAQGEWLIFLNPDTEARPNWLKKIVEGQSRHPETTVFASAQYGLDKNDTLDGVGDAYFGFGIPWRGGFGHPTSALPREGECFSPCGAAAIVRSDVFEDAGGFDERFFCYCEDVDLGFRLRLMGERCVFLPEAAVAHKGSATSGRHSDFTVYHGTRNRMWTYFKNMPFGLLVITLPGHILLSLTLLARSIPNGRFSATWRGMRDGVMGLPKILRSRQKYEGAARSMRMARAMSWNFAALRTRRPHVQEFQISATSSKAPVTS